MSTHQYRMQACKDDARRAGERDRLLLEARRPGLTHRPGAGLVVQVTRGARLLSRFLAGLALSAAVQQVEDARIYAGFHFRFSCIDAATLGAHVARYVTGTLMQPVRRTS